MGVSGWMIRAIHRLIDRALRVDQQVLNPTPGDGQRLEDVLPQFRRFIATGKVDYPHLRKAPEYQRFLEAAAALSHRTPPSGADAARAWWINLYNALIIQAVLELGIRRSVWEDRGFFRRAAYLVGGHRLSADDIEHGILRGNRPHPLFRVPQFASGDPRLQWSLSLDPRIHFALVCASNSCPAINLYTPGAIDRQLDGAASAFINGGGVLVRAHPEGVVLSQIFKWYQGDFGGRARTLQFIARYLQDESARTTLQRPELTVTYFHYDWSLNYPVAEHAG